VVLEAYRPGVMRRLGLDYDAVRADNPEVIYLSVTGYGQKGPYTGHPVTDSIMQGFSGLMSINRDSQGMPQRIGMIAIDVFTGLYAFQAVSAALYKRAVKGGGGAYIDASLMQAATAFQSAKIAEHHLVGAEQPALGAPVGTVQTSDGYINLNARRPAHFEALCRLIGRPELIDDPRFESPRARIDNEDALMPIVRAALRDWPTAKLTAALHENDILNAPINTYSEIFEDPQVEAMNAIEWVEHQGMGRVPMPNVPGIAPPRAGHPLAESPHVGQHSREILAELGHSEAEIAALAESGAVVIRDAEEALA
jgi:crotonobetainyl-CoA:carnitine CoA-transferase CaiB-like acyl-CoA transferase